MDEVQSLGRQLIAELAATFGTVCREDVVTLTDSILAAPRIFLDGKGRSGLQARAFAMRLMHLGLRAYMVDEVTTPAITADDLLIIASGSGRTDSLVQHAAAALKQHARIALISTTKSSPIAELADQVVIVPAPTPKSAGPAQGINTVQPMGSLFELVLGLLFDVVVIVLMRRMDVSTEIMFANHANLE